MSNNIWILKCSLLHTFSYKQRVQKIDDALFSTLHLFIEKLLEQNIVFEMSSKYEVIY